MGFIAWPVAGAASEGGECLGGRRRGHQPRQTDQVVGGTHEIAGEFDLFNTSVSGFAEATHGLSHPRFPQLSCGSAGDAIPRVSRCPTVNRTSPTSRVLCDVRRDVSGTQFRGHRVSYPLSSPTVSGWNRRSLTLSITEGTTAHSAVPLAVATRKSTNRPWRFSMTACPR